MIAVASLCECAGFLAIVTGFSFLLMVGTEIFTRWVSRKQAKMYLHEAFAESKVVRRNGMHVNDKNTSMIFTVEDVRADDWEPVFEKVTLGEAAKKWSVFRRRGWVNKNFYWKLDSNYIVDKYNERVQLHFDSLYGTDWEEYTNPDIC